MNYVLFANNKKFTKEFLDNITYETNDQLILFNSMMPFTISDKIKYHANKIVVCRSRATFFQNGTINKKVPWPYAGIEIAAQYCSLFQKIIPHCHMDFLNKEKKEIFNNYMDKLNIPKNKIGMLEPESKDIRETIQYPSGKNMSTGVIVYEWVKKIKKDKDKIVLIGFSSEIVEKYHNKSWEKNFFNQELINNNYINYNI